METLIDRIEAAAGRGRAVVFQDSEGSERVAWDRLLADSRAAAAALRARGIGPGSHVAVLGVTSRGLVTTIEGIWLAGATLVVLPLPLRMSLEAYVEATRRRLRRADASLLVVDPDLAAFLDPVPGDPPAVNLPDLLAEAATLGDSSYRRPTPDPAELAILQFTSGSTADPKGVMLPHRTICANLDAVAAGLALDPGTDVLVSWLPLFHDMGLIGKLTLGATTGTELVLGSPQTFLAEPARWMRWVATYGGTLTAGPNFSWALATRALAREETTLDLSSLRIALNGAEPVDPATARQLVEAGARHRLDPGAVFPAYGMAETTVGAAFPRPGTGLRTDRVDRKRIEYDGRAEPADPAGEAKELVVLGRPLRGLEVRVVGPDDAPLPDREVGGLEIRGTSVTPGYYRDPEATTRLFHDGWIRTGDLAYLVDAEVVICGRRKDIIIIGGRNVYPEDVERAVSAVAGVRPGNVIAFGTEAGHTEGLVVVAESRADDPAAITAAIRHATLAATGVSPRHVVLLGPGEVPKTSSGKLQRSLCRERYESGVYRPL